MTNYTHSKFRRMDWATLARWVEARGFPKAAADMRHDETLERAEAIAAIIWRWEPELADGLRFKARSLPPTPERKP